MATLLVVDDEPSLRELLQILLEGDGYTVITAGSLQEARQHFTGRQRNWPNLIITDLRLPDGEGITLLKEVTAQNFSTPPPVIMMTAYASTENAIEAMKLGAYDYLIKPVKMSEVSMLVERALEQVRLTQDNARLSAQLAARYGLQERSCVSEAMCQVLDLAEKVAPGRTNILIEGESGTGKEVVARSIHAASPRAKAPFVAVNCGAIPETLIEAEFFGHAKGAFTGAIHERKGLFEAASGGTLLLDEIGELPSMMQVKLLRVLQERLLRRVGDDKERPVDVRIIAATNQDLQQMVQDGNFRLDLFYRLNVVRLRVPPLRQRQADIPILTQIFIDKYSTEAGKNIIKAHAKVISLLLNYHFPGNVRELENIIERAVALSNGTSIDMGDLPQDIQDLFGEKVPSLGSKFSSASLKQGGLNLEEHLESIERQLIADALTQTEGKKTEAAKLLGLTFRSFRYRFKKLIGSDEESK